MNKMIFAAAFMAAVLCGCDKNGGQAGPEQWPALSEGLSVSASYLGDSYGSGSGAYTVTIRDSRLVFDEDLQSYIGPGESLTLSLGAPLADDMSSLVLPAGVYTASEDETHPEWTFCTAGMDRTALNVYDGEGNITVKPALGGTVTVRESGGMYWISCSLVLEDGTLDREYVGKMRVGNMSSEGFISNLTGNIACPAMEYAEVTYNSGNGAVGNYSLFLANGYNEYDGSFDEGFLVLVNAEDGHMTIPDGTYTVAASADGNDLTAGTLTPGNGPFEYAAGTWYFSYIRGYLYAQVKSGKAVIKTTEEGKVSISLNFFDGNGYSVTASFLGIPVYTN